MTDKYANVTDWEAEARVSLARAERLEQSREIILDFVEDMRDTLTTILEACGRGEPADLEDFEPEIQDEVDTDGRTVSDADPGVVGGTMSEYSVSWKQTGQATIDIDGLKAELAALREQLRLANIDAANNEAEANALRAERDRLREALVVADEAMAERRGYAEFWEYKYGDTWDEEDNQVRAALEGK